MCRKWSPDRVRKKQITQIIIHERSYGKLEEKQKHTNETLTKGRAIWRTDHVLCVQATWKTCPYNIIFVHSSSYNLEPYLIVLLNYNILERKWIILVTAHIISVSSNVSNVTEKTTHFFSWFITWRVGRWIKFHLWWNGLKKKPRNLHFMTSAYNGFNISYSQNVSRLCTCLRSSQSILA